MPSKKRPTRADRWNAAASRAKEALEELKAIQDDEFQPWLDGLPENLQSSALGEKLTAVCDIDLQGAIDTLDEAEAADLPLGFGRD